MPKTVPGRRVVVAQELLEESTAPLEATDFVEPPTRPEGEVRRLSYQERLQRRLRMADLALEKYEERLEKGDHLEPEEERLFLAHQDSIRKLEATLAQLERQDKSEEDRSDVEKALVLMDAGYSYEEACNVFKFNRELPEQLSEALDERAKQQH